MRLSPAEREAPRPVEPTAARGPFAAALAAAAAPPAAAEPALPELREAVRALPVAVWAGRLGGAPSVELAFGRDLSVELRRGSEGLELTVLVAPPLARAARADLPALSRALEARGLRVARSAVRVRPAARPEAEAGSVDGGAPLR